MAAPTNYVKLGLYVAIVTIAAVGALLLLGAASFTSDNVQYHTFFDESVQGLDIGAPVKFRGVTIGSVSKIEIAPDQRHVRVISELRRQETKRMPLGMSAETEQAEGRGLRAQVTSQGITGVKLVSVDLFDVRKHPRPALPFPAPEHYIPATPSFLKNLEEVVAKGMERLPDLADALLAIAGRVDRLLATLERSDISAEALTVLRRADEVLKAVHGTVGRLDRANVGERAATTLDELHLAASKMNSVLDRVDGEGGLLANAADAAAAFGQLGKSSRRTQRELDGTLREVGDAAAAIRSLAKALERDPEMLLKGKTPGKGFE